MLLCRIRVDVCDNAYACSGGLDGGAEHIGERRRGHEY
jgi:hypothetical protein